MRQSKQEWRKLVGLADSLSLSLQGGPKSEATNLWPLFYQILNELNFRHWKTRW